MKLSSTINLKSLFALCSILFSLSLTNLSAQGITTSSINGIVITTDGEELAGANVIAIHTPTGTKYGAATTANGEFRIPNMRVGGPYRITASYIGFENQVIEGITLSLGNTERVKFTLQVDDLALEEIVVSVTGYEDKLFNSDKTGAGNNVDPTKLTALPTISRSVNDFTRVVPQSNGTSFAGRDNRFNNYTIDGSIYNNNFGLGSAQFAGSNPISLDAIEEIQINLAPFDVRLGSFTGASVNAVTKSGSNTFKATGYTYYRNQDYQGLKIGETEFEVTDAYNQIFGVSVGGPIIKDKLFFFVSVEQEQASAPGDNRLVATATRPADGLTVSRVTKDQAEFVRTQLKSIYGYETGDYENISFANEALRFNMRLDWNINDRHKAMFRYNRFSSVQDQLVNGNSIRGFPSIDRYRNTNRFGPEALTFANTHYSVDNIIESYVAELNSNFGSNIFNSLNVSFNSVTDPKRSVPAGQTFPMIEVIQQDGAGVNQYFLSAGNELFTVGNLLENDVFSITNSTIISLNQHTITAGLSYEYMSFANAFNPVWNSWYRYASYDDFVASVINKDLTVLPSHFAVGYSYDAANPNALPLDEVNFSQFGFYVQDEFQINKDIKVYAGLRIDLPMYPNDLPRNELVENLNLNIPNPRNTSETISPDVSKLPGVNPLFSPRLGFNWDVKGDRSFQVRGGTGLFSGRLPFVWISNQANANGVTRGQIGLYAADWGVNGNPAWTGFQADPNVYRPDPATVSAVVPSQVNITADDFALPQVWRTNLAADFKLPYEVRATVEGIYSKDYNSPLSVNLANQATGSVAKIGGNDYPLYSTSVPGNPVGSSLREIYYLTNIDMGSYASLTLELEKYWDFGLYTRLAYTRSQARDYGLIGGSQAQSLWPNAVAFDRNNPEEGFSRFDQPNRIIAEVSFNSSSLDFISEALNTNISLIYVGGEAGRFSYTYSGNFGDGSGVRLMYIPKNETDAQLIDIVSGGNVVMTAAEQWAALDKYISQDEYLSENRGSISERNGGILPWLHRFDVRIAQNIGLPKFKEHKFQLTLDILNFGNMINDEWGVTTTAAQRNLLNYRGVDASGNAQFTLNYISGTSDVPTKTSREIFDLNQTWRAQIGFRYLFN